MCGENAVREQRFGFLDSILAISMSKMHPAVTKKVDEPTRKLSGNNGGINHQPPFISLESFEQSRLQKEAENLRKNRGDISI